MEDEREYESCGICGEPMRMEKEECAEMFDVKNPYKEAVICHAQCGIDAGLVIA
jgi:hypothetical protein